MVVSGLPPMGCLPIQMLSRFSRTCLTDQNTDARVYNQKLMNLLPQIQSSLKGSRIMYADIYNPMTEMIQNPRKHGKFVTLIFIHINKTNFNSFIIATKRVILFIFYSKSKYFKEHEIIKV